MADLFQKHNKHLKIGFKTRKNNKKLYGSCKDSLNFLEKTDLIYEIDCNGCPSKYIGMTSQKLKTRLAQHKLDHKNKHLHQNGTAALHHSLETGHTFNFAQAKILSTESNYHKRATKEMLFINEHKHEVVNFRTDIDNLHRTYSQLLNTITRRDNTTTIGSYG